MICKQNKTVSACADVGVKQILCHYGYLQASVGGLGKLQVVVLEECFRI